MLPMEEELIQVFCKVDDALKKMAYRNHHLSKFTAAEVITVAIMKELWGLRTIKHIWRLIRDKFSSFFPSTMLLQPFNQAL